MPNLDDHQEEKKKKEIKGPSLLSCYA